MNQLFEQFQKDIQSFRISQLSVESSIGEIWIQKDPNNQWMKPRVSDAPKPQKVSSKEPKGSSFTDLNTGCFIEVL